MRPDASITVIQHSDGFLNGLVPDADFLLAEQLKKSGRVGSQHTRRAYQEDVRRFNEWRAGQPITKSLVEEYLRQLSDEKRSPATLARALASIRWYIRAVKNLLYDSEVVARLLPETRRAEILERADRALQAQKPRGERAAGIETGHYISASEFEALLGVCLKDGSHAGVRDRAMFALAYSIGLRVHEVVGLKMKDVKLLKGEELIYQVRIIGKRNKERPVTPVLVGGAARYLQEWLFVRGREPGALFCHITRPGRLSGSQGKLCRKKDSLTSNALVKILGKRRAQTSLEHLTWHDFRRTYVRDLINRYDLVTAQKIIGYSSTRITAKYDRTWQDKIQEVAHMRAVPCLPSAESHVVE